MILEKNAFLYWKGSPDVYLKFNTSEIPVKIVFEKGEIVSATYDGEDIEPMLNTEDLSKIMPVVKRLS